MSEKKHAIENIHLTPSEEDWIVQLATARDGRMCAVTGNAPVRAMNGLVKKGFAVKDKSDFWVITDNGRKRCTSIY